MPGIVGLVTRMPRVQAVQQLTRMTHALRHEAFYVSGTWVDESLGIYLGWVARAGSFSEPMPLRNERGDVVLGFSGEEFSEASATHDLKSRRHELKPSGPEYLVHLYEDPSFPANLNGTFHGLVIDQRQKTAMLFNDRYGMHRLYYYEANDTFYFAAESKAILSVCPKAREINARSLAEFVVCGCTLEDRSLFEGVHVLPGASKWIFRDKVLHSRQKYFDPRKWEDQDHLDVADFYREAREIFSKKLGLYFGGQQQSAMSLTGGLDTRMIMAWQKCAPGSLPCYTFGGMLRDCQDVTISREVARVCDQPHQVIPVESEFLSRFSDYANRAIYLTDACVDVSRAPDLFLNEKARGIAPVRITGNCGGELLRGVVAFKPIFPPEALFASELLSLGREAAAQYANLRTGHPVSFAAFKQCPWHHYGIFALEQTQVAMRSPFLDNDFVQMLFRAPEPVLLSNHFSLQLIAGGNPALGSIPTDRGLATSNSTRASAASHFLLEFLFKAEYAFDMGMPQWLARINRSMPPFNLERQFLGRHKIFHFRTWYRDELADYVREMLLDARSLSRPYIERKKLEDVVHRHVRGDGNYTLELHKLLTLEITYRLFLDSPETSRLSGPADPILTSALN